MKRLGSWLVLALCVGLTAPAEAQLSATRRANEFGYKQFDTLQLVLTPLVNNAYPHKQYRALMDASTDIQSAVSTLSDMKVETRNSFKMKAYKTGLDKLKQSVSDYAAAAESGDSTAVYNLFGQIVEQSDQLAVAVLPVPWPEFEALKEQTMKLASKPTIDTTDQSTLVHKVEKIQDLLNLFSASTVPPSVQYRATLIGQEQAYFVKLVTSMRQILARDIDKFKLQATELSTRLVTFEHVYLQ
jgi:soluble cytochrome b562